MLQRRSKVRGGGDGGPSRAIKELEESFPKRFLLLCFFHFSPGTSLILQVLVFPDQCSLPSGGFFCLLGQARLCLLALLYFSLDSFF